MQPPSLEEYVESRYYELIRDCSKVVEYVSGQMYPNRSKIPNSDTHLCAKCTREYILERAAQVETQPATEYCSVQSKKKSSKNNVAIGLLLKHYTYLTTCKERSQYAWDAPESWLPITAFKEVLALSYPDDMSAIAGRCYDLLHLPYFYGRIPTEEAVALVGQTPGSFLLRMSSSQLGALTLTICRKDNIVRHVRISKTFNGWSIQLPANAGGTEIREFTDLGELIEAAKQPLQLLTPVGHSMLYIHITTVAEFCK